MIFSPAISMFKDPKSLLFNSKLKKQFIIYKISCITEKTVYL